MSFFFLKKIKNKTNNTTSWSRLFISKYESALAHGGCWAGAEGLWPDSSDAVFLPQLQMGHSSVLARSLQYGEGVLEPLSSSRMPTEVQVWPFLQVDLVMAMCTPRERSRAVSLPRAHFMQTTKGNICLQSNCLKASSWVFNLLSIRSARLKLQQSSSARANILTRVL